MDDSKIDFDAALDILKSPFVLIVGSFVSNKAGVGTAPLHGIAPTVPVIKHRILSMMKSRIDQDHFDRAARVIAALAVSAADPRRWLDKQADTKWPTEVGSALLRCQDVIRSIEKIKFEEFMRLLAAVSTSDGFIDKLVSASFTIPQSSFNINHSAIAHLLQSGKCFCVLTTNFDNALENACYAIGHRPDVQTILNFQNLYKRSPLLSDLAAGTIFKLHGCALRGGAVANSTELFALAEMKAFEFVEQLLRRYPTATLGYSGYGDVDIAPYIAASGKGAQHGTLIFTDREPLRGSEGRNPFAHSLRLCIDLDSDHPQKNLLIALCKRNFLSPHSGADNTRNDADLDIFFQNQCTVGQIKSAMIDLAGANYPKIKLYYWFGRGRSNLIPSSQLLWTDPQLLSIPINVEARAEIAQFPCHPLWQKTWLAFIDWRLGGLRKKATINAIKNLQETLQSIDTTRADQQILAVKIGGIIVGAAAEMLWATNRDARPLLYVLLESAVEAVRSCGSENWWKAIEPVDLMTQRELRLIEIDFALGKRLLSAAKKDITSLFDRGSSLMLLGQVRTTIRSAWLVSHKFGNDLHTRDKKENKNAVPTDRQSASVKKDIAHFLYALPLGVGRFQYIILERLLPQIAEPLWHWMSIRWGHKAKFEIDSWMK